MMVWLMLLATPPMLAVQTPDAAPSAPTRGAIEFVVHLSKSKAGQVRCALYHESSTWLSEQPHQGASATIEDGQARCRFRNVAPGRYGIAAYHDEDGDERLDTNVFGIPKEATCFSRDARRAFGPPKFEDASFHHDGSATRLQARAG
jgi:uncharacterized protein (DUF2141 family)